MPINQTHPGNRTNATAPDVRVNHSTFEDLSYDLNATVAFGQLFPHFVMQGVADDSLTYQSSHQIRTNSLKAPLMQNLQLKKEYFAIPKEAILPYQWNRIFTNPAIGDDVPNDCNTVIHNPATKIKAFLDKTPYLSYLNGSQFSDTGKVLAALFYMLQVEYFFSAGSLINVLGRNFSLRFRSTLYPNRSADYWIDGVIDSFISNLKSFSFFKCDLDGNNDLYHSYMVDMDIVNQSGYSSDNHISIRRFFEIFRDDPCITITSLSFRSDSSITEFVADLVSLINSVQIYNENDNDPFNYDVAVAYQLVCSHFYTNDFVDFIYEADLYRQNLKYVIDKTVQICGFSVPYDFSWNGVKLMYDYASGHFLSALMQSIDYTDYFPKKVRCITTYLSLLFSFRQSLRYQDYFTGSKPRPLAVGDVSVNVQSNLVNVIDVTRKIQMQRYLNAVLRTGRKISEYTKGLFGTDMRPDYHNPLYLGGTMDSVGSYEVENTGEGQLTQANSITSIIKNASSRYGFDINLDRNMVLLGICYFDIKRNYCFSSDRSTMHVDRFDMFNPMMQYIGDQPVYSNEISSYSNAQIPQNFGYQGRYMEYKQRFSRSVGGFVEFLPGYIFNADNVKALEHFDRLDNGYIRSSCVELEPFFLHLTGYSPSSYIQFIVKFSNVLTKAKRPMAFSPQIL